ncbi:putative sphingosine kinase (SphK) [Aspergillus candidus]|uniref:Sphingosine kinase n=1 Tax=Aspergillus candidus TaxID=41067 RepID=A0A2I2F1W7_ASPCN|nr:sphingosine kinase [Aspergillus candidus]PLB34633.1 sphingosine kinase [Aspergillus candidus]
MSFFFLLLLPPPLSSLSPLFLLSLLLFLFVSTPLLFFLWRALYDALFPSRRTMTSPSPNGASRPPLTHPDQPDSQQHLLAHDASLTVAQSVSLTLAGDSLIVLDERPSRQADRTCCGLLPLSAPQETHSIALFNILDADLTPTDLTITYAAPQPKSEISVATLHYPVAQKEKAQIEKWVAKLLDLAYGAAQRHRRLKVLINPFGGQGGARKLYHKYAESVFAATGCRLDVQETTHRGHATEIAENIDVDAYDAIVCCSGDGLPYEVFNGLAKKPNAREALAKVAVAMLPCGSGNAMSWNLYGTGSVSVAALTIAKGVQTPIDLVSLTQGQTRTLSFLSQSFGIVAESDLGTDDIRWMGAHRFTYGFLVRLMRRTIYPCDLAMKVVLDDKKAIKDHYEEYAGRPAPGRPDEVPAGGLPELQYGTVQDELPSDWEVIPGETMGNFYAGNMAIMSKDTSFFPAAVPQDGLMDVVTIDGTVSRSTSIKMMTSIPEGTFFDMPDVHVRKVAAYRLIPRETEGYISVDGESVPFEGIQAEVHQGLGTVLSKSGHLYETDGPRP